MTGRPSKLEPQRKELLIKALETGAHVETACQAAGIAYSTFHNWMQRGEGRHPTRSATKEFVEFVEDIKGAIAKAEMVLLSRIQVASKRDWRSAAWILERRHPDRWANTQRVQVEVEKQLEQQFDQFFEGVMNDPNIPHDIKQLIIEKASDLAGGSEVAEPG